MKSPASPDAWRKPSRTESRNLMTTTHDIESNPQAVPLVETPVHQEGPPRKPIALLTKVSIVIPVYNEEATVQYLIDLVVTDMRTHRKAETLAMDRLRDRK